MATNTKGTTMSAITLDSAILNAIAAPISARTVAPADPKLIDFAKSVVTLDNAGLLAQVIADATPVQVVPAPKPRKRATMPARKGAKAEPMAANWDGTMMKSSPNTASRGQIRNVERMAKQYGYVLDAPVATWSMVDASNEYRAMKVECGLVK
jgi:hypothetical protein